MENNFYRPLTIDEVYFEKPVFFQIPITEPGNHGLSIPENSVVYELPQPDLSKAIYKSQSIQQTENFFLKNWPVLLISGLIISGYIYYRVKKKKKGKR